MLLENFVIVFQTYYDDKLSPDAALHSTNNSTDR